MESKLKLKERERVIAYLNQRYNTPTVKFLPGEKEGQIKVLVFHKKGDKYATEKQVDAINRSWTIRNKDCWMAFLSLKSAQAIIGAGIYIQGLDYSFRLILEDYPFDETLLSEDDCDCDLR